MSKLKYMLTKSHVRFILFIFMVTCIALMSVSSLSLAQQPSGGYDPTIHVYREGLDLGVMNDNVTIGTFSVPIEVRPSFWTVAIRSRKTEENWEIIENGTAKKTDIQRGI